MNFVKINHRQLSSFSLAFDLFCSKNQPAGRGKGWRRWRPQPVG